MKELTVCMERARPRPPIRMVVVLCASLAAAVWAQETVEPVEARRELKFVVVNLDRVFERSEEWEDYQERGRRLLEDRRRTMAKYREGLDLLKLEYDNLAPGTAERQEKQAQMEATLKAMREDEQKLDEAIVQQRREAFSTMFGKIGAVIDTYAREQGLDLVLRRQDLRVSADQPALLGEVLTTAHVLYARDEFDATEQIVSRLNEEYPQEVQDR